MRRVLHIAWREYLENVRTKAFLVAVCMTPLILGMSILVPSLLAKKRPEVRRIGLVDVAGGLAEPVEARLGKLTFPGPPPSPLYATERIPVPGEGAAERAAALAGLREGLDARVRAGTLFAWVVVRPSAVSRAEGEPASEYRAANLVDVKVFEDVRRALTDATNARIVAERAVPAEVAAQLVRAAPMSLSSAVSAGQAESVAATVMPFVFMLLLFVTIVAVSQALITSTLEEKGNRVLEVLLSSVSPFQLMAGKVFGTCAVGLTLISIWAGASLGALAANGIHLVEASQLGLCVVYYLLGFVLIASLMVGVGSVCTTLKEAQNLLGPVMFLLTIPMFFWIAIGKEPNGTLATILSWIPPFTPFVMMMRIASVPAPSPLEIAGSLVLLATSAWLAMHVAAKIFRVGSLLYGKPPSIREIVRWARARG